MNWYKIKEDFVKQLTKTLGEHEVNAVFALVMEHFTGIYRPKRATFEEIVSEEITQKIQTIIQRLHHHEPIQYILGYAYFDDLKLTVNSQVLIPRQETEELVYQIVNDFDTQAPLSIIDFGTGSGAIALSLAKHFPNATITAIDISKDALQIAQKNAKNHNVTNISFQQNNILQLTPILKKFDIIVSNPPYILPSYKSNMNTNVTKHEPSLALYTPENQPLIFYSHITDFAQTNLQANGKLYFEINEFFKEEMLTMLTNKNFTSKAIKDINGLWRMTKSERNNKD